MNNQEIIIHGDVVLKPCKIPATAKKIDGVKSERGVVVERGEHTGHSHTLTPTENCQIDVFEEGDLLYFKISGDHAILTHEEHGAELRTVGEYVKQIETEVNPFTQAVRKVQD